MLQVTFYGDDAGGAHQSTITTLDFLYRTLNRDRVEGGPELGTRKRANS